MKVKIKENIDAILFFLVAVALNAGLFYLRYKVILEISEVLFFILGFLQLIFNVVIFVVSEVRCGGMLGSIVCAVAEVFHVLELIGYVIMFLSWVYFYIVRL